MIVARNVGTIACPDVLGDSPILRLEFDWDGDLQVLCGHPHSEDTLPKLICLGEFLDKDPGIAAVLEDLDQGQVALRAAPGAPWMIDHLPPEEQAA